MMSDVVDKGAPFEMLGLDHVVLRIRDLEKMRAFYCDVLGCTFEDHDTDLGLYQVRAGNQLIDLVPVSGKAGSAGGAAPGAEGHNMDHFAIQVEPYDDDAIRESISRIPRATRWNSKVLPTRPSTSLPASPSRPSAIASPSTPLAATPK
jgi:hypothetical protein